jgi:ABC-type microcin C transport system duplicated ATPase subunit YejF
MEHVRGNDVSMIFQRSKTALNPVFTVGDQIAESLEIHEHLSVKDAKERAEICRTGRNSKRTGK